MKTKFVVSMSALLVAANAFAQGYINWSTASATYFKAATNSTQYSPLSAELGSGQATGGGATGFTTLTANSFYYALLYTTAGTAAPTTLAALNSWSTNSSGSGGTLMGVNNQGTPGQMSPTGTAGSQVSWASGTSMSIVVVGWSANLGTTLQSVLGYLNNWASQSSSIVGPAYFGISSAADYTGNPASPGKVAFSSTAINSPNTQLYLLQTVPEPTTLALAGLGGAALLLFRRRK